MSRKYFEKAGKLFQCPNPAHHFSLWKIVGQWRWAKEAWSSVTESGYLLTTWFGVTKTETPKGLSLITLTFGKLQIIMGWKC